MIFGANGLENGCVQTGGQLLRGLRHVKSMLCSLRWQWTVDRTVTENLSSDAVGQVLALPCAPLIGLKVKSKGLVGAFPSSASWPSSLLVYL